ncbi:BA75_01050T0 [Komagataella pastoris]|uniref:ferroxidase n=1 Tax=Komagataella pastoris TaxID=4922 RepID=A0A1B2J8I4_PICPA|nr:BA75_01050T0 [Komagataella pastoris]
MLTKLLSRQLKRCNLSNRANNIYRHYSIGSTTDGRIIFQEIKDLSLGEYHQAADSTLENMTEDLERFFEKNSLNSCDVEYSSGILTLQIPKLGDYVINKQPPNKQIWLSSPLSGPKRFDYYRGLWIDSRTIDSAGQITNVSDNTLHDLLAKEVSKGTRLPFQFNK